MFESSFLSNSTKKAAIYVRVSTLVQDKTGHGIEGQIEICKQVCDFKDYSIYDIYKDNAVSGTVKHTERPGFKKLLEDAKSKKFEVIVFYDLDRIGRSMKVIVNTIEDLHKLGLKVVSCMDEIDTTTDDGMFMMHIYASVVDMELRTIKRRLREGLREKRERTGIIGGPLPYGYVRVDKEIAIDPHQSKIVCYIFQEHQIYKVSMNQIAKNLTKHGILTSKGKKTWHRDTIRGILKNKDKYLGTELMNRNKNNIYWSPILDSSS